MIKSQQISELKTGLNIKLKSVGDTGPELKAENRRKTELFQKIEDICKNIENDPNSLSPVLS